MSPFAHLLYELRVARRLRQTELAELVGYDATYISALEIGQKGPPTEELVGRLCGALRLRDDEAERLRKSAEASQRKFVMDADAPQDVYWLFAKLREQLPTLEPEKVRLIENVLDLQITSTGERADVPRRPRRRAQTHQEASM